MTKSIGRSFRIVLLCTVALVCLTLSFNRRALADGPFGVTCDLQGYQTCDEACGGQPYCFAACYGCAEDYCDGYGGAIFYTPPPDYACYPPE
jgi:hypothetical protein